MSTPRPLRVMQSFSAVRETTNPYLKQLLAATTTPDCDPRTFSWTAAIRGDFDVLHLHWPEVLLRGSSRPKTWGRRLGYVLMLLRLRSRRRAMVRTLHNLAPHEAASPVERLLLRWTDRATSLWITLVPSTPVPSGSQAPRRTIPHGHYRDWFADVPCGVPPASGRLLYFGLIRPYKGVEELLAAFTALTENEDADGEGPTLRIVGAPKDRALAERITELAELDPRIEVRLEYVSDPELAEEIAAAGLVVLPYQEMHNSGSALLALSLGRVILVPDNEVTRELAEEVGEDWVFSFAGRVSGEDLRDALTSSESHRPSQPPRLSGRDWAGVGEAHVGAYREALAGRSQA